MAGGVAGDLFDALTAFAGSGHGGVDASFGEDADCASLFQGGDGGAHCLAVDLSAPDGDEIECAAEEAEEADALGLDGEQENDADRQVDHQQRAVEPTEMVGDEDEGFAAGDMLEAGDGDRDKWDADDAAHEDENRLEDCLKSGEHCLLLVGVSAEVARGGRSVRYRAVPATLRPESRSPTRPCFPRLRLCSPTR